MTTTATTIPNVDARSLCLPFGAAFLELYLAMPDAACTRNTPDALRDLANAARYVASKLEAVAAGIDNAAPAELMEVRGQEALTAAKAAHTRATKTRRRDDIIRAQAYAVQPVERNPDAPHADDPDAMRYLAERLDMKIRKAFMELAHLQI